MTAQVATTTQTIITNDKDMLDALDMRTTSYSHVYQFSVWFPLGLGLVFPSETARCFQVSGLGGQSLSSSKLSLHTLQTDRHEDLHPWNQRDKTYTQIVHQKRNKYFTHQEPQFIQLFYTTATTTVYSPFSGTTQVSRCQKRNSGLYGARED